MRLKVVSILSAGGFFFFPSDQKSASFFCLIYFFPSAQPGSVFTYHCAWATAAHRALRTARFICLLLACCGIRADYLLHFLPPRHAFSIHRQPTNVLPGIPCRKSLLDFLQATFVIHYPTGFVGQCIRGITE